MAENLTWSDAGEVGILLSQTHPDLTPLSVALPDLQKYVSELPGFSGAPAPSKSTLEAIRKAWHEEFQDRTQD